MMDIIALITTILTGIGTVIALLVHIRLVKNDLKSNLENTIRNEVDKVKLVVNEVKERLDRVANQLDTLIGYPVNPQRRRGDPKLLTEKREQKEE